EAGRAPRYGGTNRLIRPRGYARGRAPNWRRDARQKSDPLLIIEIAIMIARAIMPIVAHRKYFNISARLVWIGTICSFMRSVAACIGNRRSNCFSSYRGFTTA